MLEKIISIDNVGVLKKAAQRPIDLQKVSLIYADNARGKSTLSSVLLACSTFEAKDVSDRKTVGATHPQKIILRFNQDAHSGAFNAQFDGIAWAGQKPNLHVFNQAFVDRNVYASSGVLPEQREALLNLALGDAAVAQRTKFDAETVAVRECTATVSAAEAALQGYRGHLSLTQYIKLTPLSNVDEELVQVDKLIGEARASEQIRKRPEFRAAEFPAFNFDDIPDLLEGSFESISVTAEETARAHFAKHNGTATERWAAEGLHHQPDDECPFCGQPTQDLQLLKAYKLYFDGSYSEYQRRINQLRHLVKERVGEHQLSTWRACNEYNLGLRSVWSESSLIDEIPVLDHEMGALLLHNVEEALLKIVSVKENDPIAALDSTQFMATVTLLSELGDQTREFNRQIDELNGHISTYKQSLAAPDLSALNQRRELLTITKNRFSAEVVALNDDLDTAKTKLRAAEQAREAARSELDRLMAATLLTFQGGINGWLRKFAAPFVIDSLRSTHLGGGLRTEYVLKVRGARVVVGPGTAGDLSFHAALSEGDKRTLAFAFFLARLFADPKRAEATVVLDDVFTSLDKHRRHNTIEAVLQIATECSQVIALGHDAHFLREVKRRVERKKVATVGELSLQRDAEDYSHLDSFDLDEYCSSDYYKHYELVERFIAGDATCSLLEVAKALRLLVEGHLHRCFPKKFKEGQTVGDMLGQVKAAVAPNPLALLQPLHADLVSFNEFAAAFHHDTSGGYVRAETTQAELLPFAKGALGFIQMRTFQ
jgi:wobble nucleotide-excising tRNase